MSHTFATSASAGASASNTITALTTTFTPPSACTGHHFTMLSSPGYQVWMNEPMPVSSSIVSSCYPSEWLENYSTAASGSSIVPAMSPLVCPLSWKTVLTAPGNYIACCPPGFSQANPSTTVDGYRPFYGGTCYSDVTSGQVLDVTQYNSLSITASISWTVSMTSAQVYAHPIDGYMLQEAITTVTKNNTAVTTDTSTTSSSKPTTSTSTSLSATSFVSPSPSAAAKNYDGHLSGGAIAGVVVGIVAGVTVLVVAIFLILRRRARSNKGQTSDALPYSENEGASVPSVSIVGKQSSSEPHATNEPPVIEKRESDQLLAVERDATRPLTELPSPPAVVELDSRNYTDAHEDK